MSSNSFHTLSVVSAVGKVTFFEVIQDKVLYNIVLCSFALLGLGVLASRLTFIRPERVVVDFGLTALGLSCNAIAILTGAGLINKEFENRTIHLALSRPISRGTFLFGKFAGLSAILALNWFLLLISYLIILTASSPEGPFALISGPLLIGVFMVLIEGMLLSSLVLMISTFSTTSLTVIIAIGLYLVGTNITQLRLVAARTHSSFGQFALNSLAAILPNLEPFHFGTKVTYALPVSWRFVVSSVLYGMVVMALSLTLASFLIRNREVS